MNLRVSFLSVITFAAALTVVCGGGDKRAGGDDLDDCLGGQVTTWGEAPIFTSIDASRDKAKENACRKAVEKCIGEEVARRSGVSNGRAIGMEVYSESKGICKNDQITDEKKYKIDTVDMLKVFVNFKISEVDLNNHIDTALKFAGNPKVMVLIQEEYDLPDVKKKYGFADADGTVSSSMRTLLVKRGYSVIPTEKARINRTEENAIVEDPTGDTNVIQKLKDKAAEVGADVLIIGKVEAKPQTGIKSLQGTSVKSTAIQGNIRIVTLWGNGKELGTYTPSSGAIPGAGVTWERAARTGAGRFAQQLDKFTHGTLQEQWRKVTLANEIIVNIRGMDSRAAGLFRDDLKNRTGVKSVDEVKRDESLTVFEVTYPGRAFSLADTINYYGSNPAKFNVVNKTCRKLKVDAVRRGVIDVRLVDLETDTNHRCVPPK